VLILPLSTNKTVAKQFLTSVPLEEEHGTPEGFDLNEFGNKLLHPVKYFNLSDDIFYSISRDKFSHFLLQAISVDWLETFSPPPDNV
jgi:hypothetical protein